MAKLWYGIVPVLRGLLFKKKSGASLVTFALYGVSTSLSYMCLSLMFRVRRDLPLPSDAHNTQPTARLQHNLFIQRSSSTMRTVAVMSSDVRKQGRCVSQWLR